MDKIKLDKETLDRFSRAQGKAFDTWQDVGQGIQTILTALREIEKIDPRIRFHFDGNRNHLLTADDLIGKISEIWNRIPDFSNAVLNANVDIPEDY